MEELPTLPVLIARIESSHPFSDPLARLADAVETGASISALADHLVGHFVDEARAAGASWAQIGVALGVSKQAVQQRFVPREPATVADFDIEVQRFSRFTPRCLNCVLGAEKIAVATGAAAVTPTHILIGLFVEPQSLAIHALADNGADPAQVRAAAVETLPPAPEGATVLATATATAPSQEPAIPGNSLPFTPEARKTFDLAVRAALSAGHNYVGTEHLLLALAGDPKSETALLLTSFGLTRDGLEASVQRLLMEFMANSGRRGSGVSPLDPAEQGAPPAEG
ncbi:Clp domain protein [Catenulispora acidiphila DSM 44928]|uniref:Clp domain protein n=1 Tax=Catenulispora acidiphila (strain DSM 44928 / JCM 14897 / NBRC 102108 / NRRL B-24433 / ID139908) TaxID=479433 RepID=C7QJ13_CATAD|nr:Clp protease N-terminal domain-containing protein [Catenulispora acidiphila]ACU69155.1 Clp domain protein [Catenulispora acidiphila DSM 44928]